MRHIFLPLINYLQSVCVIVEFETRKLMHQPSELLFRSIQPVLWLVLFGEVMEREITHISKLPFSDFITPGILAQSVLFIAIFNGIAVIWERDMGIVQKLIVAPVARSAIVVGKGLGSGLRALSQLLVVYILAYFLGVKLNLAPSAVVQVIGFLVLGAVLFSTFSLVIACLVKTRERFMGIGQVITMPLFFASNAIYPVADMPGWLKGIALSNPLTYQIDALRAIMLADGTSAFGLGLDLLVLILATLAMIGIGTFLYPQLAR